MKAIKPQSSRLCAQTRCVPILVCSGNTQRTCNVNYMYISIAVYLYIVGFGNLWTYIWNLRSYFLNRFPRSTGFEMHFSRFLEKKLQKRSLRLMRMNVYYKKIWFWIYILNRAYISWVHLIKVATKFIVVQSWSFSSYLIKEKTYKVIPIFAQYWV